MIFSEFSILQNVLNSFAKTEEKYKIEEEGNR